MKYSDGRDVKAGDKVQAWTGCFGIVVGVIEKAEYVAGHMHEKWGYLKTGILVETDAAGLIHYPELDEDFELLERGDGHNEKGRPMKWVKYLGAGFCVLLAIGTLPSIYLIALGLVADTVTTEELIYFSGKLFVYIGMIIVLGIIAVRLFKSARGKARWSRASDPMKEPSHDFDYLRQWASLPDDGIRAIFSGESVDVLKRTVRLLGDKRQQAETIDEKHFVSLVREMRRLLAEGSKALGTAIIEASDHKDRGDLESARNVYEDFLRLCPSEFYRRIARHQLEEL